MVVFIYTGLKISVTSCQNVSSPVKVSYSKREAGTDFCPAYTGQQRSAFYPGGEKKENQTARPGSLQSDDRVVSVSGFRCGTAGHVLSEYLLYDVIA